MSELKLRPPETLSLKHRRWGKERRRPDMAGPSLWNLFGETLLETFCGWLPGNLQF
jgi:hypothetical protein